MTNEYSMTMRGYVFTFNLSRMSANFEERRESLVREPTQSEPDSTADWRSFSNVFDNGSQPQQPELRIILDLLDGAPRSWRLLPKHPPVVASPTFAHSCRPLYNIWMFLHVAAGHRLTLVLNSQSAPSLSGERFAVIIDAKLRSAGYVLGTEDRKFLEYARSHGAELQRQGFEKVI